MEAIAPSALSLDVKHVAKKKPIAAASWALFDAANSAFPLVMTTAVFVLYFKGVVVGGDDPGRSDLLWGLTLSISAALVALCAPYLGSVADIRGARKRVLLGTTILAIGATWMLSYSGAGMVAFAMVFFILANAGFEGGMVMYGALLPSVATPQNTGRLSGIGWAVGYIGGLVCLLICMPWATSGDISTVIRFVAVWFAVLAIPIFAFVPEPPPDKLITASAFQALLETIGMVLRHPGLRLFFIAYLIYNDAIITVFSFAAPFATDVLGFSMKDVILLVAGVQVTGAIGAFGFGYLSDKIGHIRTIVITLVLWIGVVLVAFGTALDLPLWANTPDVVETAVVPTTPESAKLRIDPNDTAIATVEATAKTTGNPLRSQVFWVIGLLVGFTMGATQSSSRAFLAVVSPTAISGRLFGLYAVAGRFSAVVGPTLFGLISFWTGSKAWSVLSLAILFAVGLILIIRVRGEDVRKSLHNAYPS